MKLRKLSLAWLSFLMVAIIITSWFPIATVSADSQVPSTLVDPTDLPPAYLQFLSSVGGSHYIKVKDQQIHYVEAGPKEQPTLLLLHGSPDNIFSWRDIMPALAQHYHVIAPDLLGFGLSSRPNIKYTWSTEIDYLTGFIEAMKLHHFNLIATDIGGLFGFAYASEHPENVASITMWETVTAPIPSYEVLGSYCQVCVGFFQTPREHPEYLIYDDQLASQIYQGSLLHPLDDAQLAGYAYFLNTPQKRKVVTDIGAQMPIAGDPANNFKIISKFAFYLRTNDGPKLLLYATPGSILPGATAMGLGMPNTTYYSVGAGYHYSG